MTQILAPLPATTHAAAVAALRQCGVVGAGGAGFPAYVKAATPTPLLIVNGTESEPGFFGDKLLLRDAPDAVAAAIASLGATFGYGRVVVAVKEHHAAFAADLATRAGAVFDLAYVPNEYLMGEEKTLTRHVTGQSVPKGQLPAAVGATVHNVETVLNMAAAITRHQPVTRKVLQIQGEVAPHTVAAPIGTPAATIFTHLGIDPGSYTLVDGGPLLGDVVGHDAVVRRTTNGFLVCHPDFVRTRGKHYPLGAGATGLHGVPSPWPQRIETVRASSVSVPLGGGHCRPATPIVNVGDPVQLGDEVAVAASDGFSVNAHASITGRVTRVTDQAVHIAAG